MNACFLPRILDGYRRVDVIPAITDTFRVNSVPEAPFNGPKSARKRLTARPERAEKHMQLVRLSYRAHAARVCWLALSRCGELLAKGELCPQDLAVVTKAGCDAADRLRILSDDALPKAGKGCFRPKLILDDGVMPEVIPETPEQS